MKESRGIWDFPGWWLDFGENWRGGLIREIYEEMWLEVMWVDSKPSYFVTAEKPENHCRIAHVFYEVVLKNIDFTPSRECQQVKFFSREEAKNIPSNVNLQPFLEQFLK